MGRIGSTVVSVFVYWFVRQANIVRAVNARSNGSNLLRVWDIHQLRRPKKL